MNPNNSPWLAQLNLSREVKVIKENCDCDVLIVGAGIAGIMTAYFTLKYTDRMVTVLEGSKVAHGATGHNAGQIVSDFEKRFTELVRDFGIDKASDAERSVRSSWVLLEQMFEDASLTTPLSSFMGYNGLRTVEHVVDEIISNRLRKEAGLLIYPIYVSSEVASDQRFVGVPKEFYEVITEDDILSLLETDDRSYIAVTSTRKGCVNGALLTEELAGYMLKKFGNRFRLFEHTSVKVVELDKESANVLVSTNRKDGNPEDEFKVHANRVILCTNGFERLHIKNLSGDDIDTKFHHMISGNIGYMAAYTEPLNNPPTAIAYFDQEGSRQVYGTDDYFYITRRPFETEKNERHNLICIGGPQTPIEHTERYNRYAPFEEEKGKEIDTFLKQTFRTSEKKELEYKFKWHGIMCYTPSGMRVIGSEPKNELLMYNLGCNGVGIMSSIYGGHKIAKLLKGDKFPPSAFDPKV